MESVHDRLKKQRQKRKLTQRQVAEAIGLGQDSVSKHESGKMGVAVETYRAYARLYGVTVDYLAGDAIETPALASGAPWVTREFGVPMAVARLLSSGRCNPVDDAEIAHLSKHISEGNSAELDDLEIHLLAYRAERDRTEEALQRFSAAIRRASGTPEDSDLSGRAAGSSGIVPSEASSPPNAS